MQYCKTDPQFFATEPLTSFLDAFPDVVREIYNQNFTTIFQGGLDNAFLSEPSQGQAEIATAPLKRG